MSTIKIDKGFTQRIQHKSVSHPPPHAAPPPAPPPSRKGLPAFAWVAMAAGALAIVGGLVAAVVSASKPPANRPPAASAVQTAPVVPAPSVASTAGAASSVRVESGRGAEPARATPAPTASSSALTSAPPAKPSAPQKPIHREVQLGDAHGLTCDYFENIKGDAVAALRAEAAYPGSPSRIVQIGAFELSERIGNNYGVRVRGYLVPPASGTYRFAVCVDDTCEFGLSTDESPANLRRLVTVAKCASKSWTERPEQMSEACELVAGKKYYLEAVMKQGMGQDLLRVAWWGPVADKLTVIKADYLYPWSDAPVVSADEQKRLARQKRDAALAAARAAVAEQVKSSGTTYRFAEAARALQAAAAAETTAEARTLLEDGALRLELLAKLRPFLQSELAKAPVKGVWVAFGGQADVTGASDEGVTVAPGRIVAWNKVPRDQMLRLINATVPKAVADLQAKGSLLLASAVFSKEFGGGLDLALKYRERATALSASLASVADRALGGTPEALKARPRIESARAELRREAVEIEGVQRKVAGVEAALAEQLAQVPGAMAQYWDELKVASLDDVRKQGLLDKRSPSSTARVAAFETPSNRAEFYVAQVKGLLVPSESGDYVFYVSADDQGEFYLSTDETQEKAALCVKTDSHSGPRQWDKEKRKSKPVHLEKGKRYAVRGLMREGERGDNFAVAWSTADANAPVLITCTNLFCEPSAPLPAKARDLRKSVEEDLQSVRSLASEVAGLRAADEAAEDSGAALTSAAADEVQKQAARAKEALRSAEEALKRAEAGVAEVKSALQPEAPKAPGK